MLISHLRLVLRDLRRRPTFALTVVLTLAVGIGAVTAAFALVDAVFLTRLPVWDQGRLVEMLTTSSARGVPRFPVMWDVPDRLRARRDVFNGVAAFRFEDPYPFEAREGGRTVHILATGVDGHFFDVLGVRPELGRFLRADDNVRGGPDLVVLSDGVWRHDFGADPTVLGRLLFFAGGPHRIIGIAPPEFTYPAGTNAWTPVVREIQRQTGGTGTLAQWGWFLVGRLRPGATRQAAWIELNAALRADSTSGAYTADWGVLPTAGIVDWYTDVVLGHEVRPGVALLFGAVALVLIIACTNTAGLVLARGISRTQELSIRSSLGASQAHLVLYLLSESVVLGVLGGALGMGLAVCLIHGAVVFAPSDLPLIHGTVTFAPSNLPMIGSAHVDAHVFMFVALATLASIIGFGVMPAVRGARGAEARVSRDGGRTATARPVTGLVRRALVTAQVALALVVLSAAGALGGAIARLDRTPLGFDPQHLLFFRLDFMLPSSAIGDANLRMRRFADQLGQRLPATAGLGPLTTTLTLPFGGGLPADQYVLEDARSGTDGRGGLAHFDHALDDYFGVMQVAIVRGRPIARTDDAGAPPAAVVSKSLADALWPGQDPIGQRVRFPTDTAKRWWTVVGVSADTRYSDPAASPAPTIYISQRQAPWSDPWFVVHISIEPTRAARSLEQAIVAADPTFGVAESTAGASLVRARLARPRALTAVFGALAATALFLTVIGLFGMLAGYVRERGREIAVRSALGASPSQLRALVLTQTMSVAGLGILAGLPLALGGWDVLRRAAIDVGAVHTLTLVAVIGLLLVIVALVTYAPMVAATRIDARTALALE